MGGRGGSCEGHHVVETAGPGEEERVADHEIDRGVAAPGGEGPNDCDILDRGRGVAWHHCDESVHASLGAVDPD